MHRASGLKDQQIVTALAGLAPARPVAVLKEGDTTQQRQLFIYDVKATAIGIVKLLSCFNGASMTSSFRLPLGLDLAIPEYPYSFVLLDGSEFMRQLSNATRVGLKGYRHYLLQLSDEAKELMRVPGAGSAVSPDMVAGAVEVASTAACFAKLAVNDCLSVARKGGLHDEIPQLAYLVSLLDDVIGGKAPLWSDDGFVEPRSDFTLRQRRVHLNAMAVIVREHREEPVMVTNISLGGLGFEGAQSFGIGQAVVISLADQERSFAGIIAWRQAAHAGVRFDEALAADDPLLVAVE